MTKLIEWRGYRPGYADTNPDIFNDILELVGVINGLSQDIERLEAIIKVGWVAKTTILATEKEKDA